jgi:hypothetical protein
MGWLPSAAGKKFVCVKKSKKHDIENEPKTLNEINEANAFIILKCSFAEFEFVICSRQFAAIHGL